MSDTDQGLKKLIQFYRVLIEQGVLVRTKFTNTPPYVGVEGIALALNEALDERDQYLRAIHDLRNEAQGIVAKKAILEDEVKRLKRIIELAVTVIDPQTGAKSLTYGEYVVTGTDPNGKDIEVFSPPTELPNIPALERALREANDVTSKGKDRLV